MGIVENMGIVNPLSNRCTLFFSNLETIPNFCISTNFPRTSGMNNLIVLLNIFSGLFFKILITHLFLLQPLTPVGTGTTVAPLPGKPVTDVHVEQALILNKPSFTQNQTTPKVQQSNFPVQSTVNAVSSFNSRIPNALAEVRYAASMTTASMSSMYTTHVSQPRLYNDGR